jgi:hypothetical protein
MDGNIERPRKKRLNRRAATSSKPISDMLSITASGIP